jgi:hypothetical protein
VTPLLDSRNRYAALYVDRDDGPLDAGSTPLGADSSRATCGSAGAWLCTASFPYQNKKIVILKRPTADHEENEKFFLRTVNIKGEITINIRLETPDTQKVRSKGAIGLGSNRLIP